MNWEYDNSERFGKRNPILGLPNMSRNLRAVQEGEEAGIEQNAYNGIKFSYTKTSAPILARMARESIHVNIFNMTSAKLNCDSDVLIGFQFRKSRTVSRDTDLT